MMIIPGLPCIWEELLESKQWGLPGSCHLTAEEPMEWFLLESPELQGVGGFKSFSHNKYNAQLSNWTIWLCVCVCACFGCTNSLLDSGVGWSGCPGCAGSRGRAELGSRESDRRTCRAARALRYSATPASKEGTGGRLPDGSTDINKTYKNPFIT